MMRMFRVIRLIPLVAWCTLPILAAQPNALPNQSTATSANYQARLLDLPASERPMKVAATFHLLAIHEIDDEAEIFEFSGILTLVWKDPRQAFDPATEGVDEIVFSGNYQFNELSPAWYPQVVLGNASGMSDSQGVLLRVKPDGTTTLSQMISAEARSRLNLRRYPFDQQRLEAVFGVLGFKARDVEFITDARSASADFSRINVPQWNLTWISATNCLGMGPNVMNHGDSSLFVLSLDMRRQSFFMVRLVLVPLIMIVVLSWSVFWMDRSSLGDRMSVSFVGILTAVAYQTMVSDIMPHIAYMTFMNAFLNFSFMVMCATAVVNLVVGACDKRGNSKLGDRIDCRCRWIFPMVYAALILVDAAGMFLFF